MGATIYFDYWPEASTSNFRSTELLILATYSYELEFWKTTEHGNADALSQFS